MRVRSDIDKGRVREAQQEFEMAESKLDSALQHTRESDKPNNAADFVHGQRSIERSTKAIFRLMNVHFPNKHAIDPASQDGRHLLNAISDEVTTLNFPSQMEGHLTEDEIEELHVRAVSRLMFLCKMYGEMYTLASYGIDETDFQLSPNKLVEDGEYSVILESAVTGLRISDAIIDSIATGELPRTNRPTGKEGPMEHRSAIEGKFYGVGKRLTDYDPVSEYRRKL